MGLYIAPGLVVDVIIGASLSEPHTNRVYEKIAVLLYVCMVCMYVCVSAIRRPRVFRACAVPTSAVETLRALSK